MLLHETNAREFGLNLGALFVSEIDESLNPSSKPELRSIRQATEAYADFFGLKDNIRALGGRDAVAILQSGFGLYHQCAMQIRVKYGDTAADHFKVAFLATFYVRGRNAGMPPPVTAQVQSQIRDAAQRICSSGRTERFLTEESAEALFAYLNHFGVMQNSKPDASNRSTETLSWQVFISHASEDKEDVARPLASGLQEKGYRVWFDEFTLRVGDSYGGQSTEACLARTMAW